MNIQPNPVILSASAAGESARPATTDDPERTTDHTPSGTAARLPHIPGYEIRKELGRGGMGVVYLALHRDLNRLVALKVLLNGDVASGPQAARFLGEAEALAAIPHPGIVQVFDRGTWDGLPYFAMEFCPGGSLSDRVKEAPLAAAEAARVVELLARAVAFAHLRGVLHRDLKPANVLHAADGTPKVSDFGLAKRLDQEESDEPLTQAGAILGTPNYMAPEQAEGREAGPAADVYALGAILYRVLSGRPPFIGSNRAVTLRMVIASEPVPPGQLNAAVPRDLETICLKCLQKLPAHRYASAGELADDLGRFLGNRPILARPTGRVERLSKWVRRHPTRAALVATLALLVLTAAGAASLLAIQEHTAAKDLKASNDQLSAEQVEKDRALRDSRMSAARLALDKGQLLCEQGDVGLGLVTIGTGLQPAIEAGAGDLESAIRFNLAAWQREMWQLRIVQEGPVGAHVSVARVSPDGKTLAVAYSNNLVELWHLGDDQRGERRPLVHDATVVQLEFSSDGRRLLARSRDLAQVWDVTTGKAIGPAIRHGGTLLAAAMSPDGTTLVTSGDDKRLRLWDLAAPTPSPKEMQQSLPTRLIAFRPDGKQLVSSDGLELRRWDAGTGRAVEPAMKHGAMVAALAFSRDGKRVITGTTQSPKLGSSTACLWDADTAKLQLELPIPGAGVNDVAFTSDGDVFAAITLEGLVQVRRADTGVLLTSPPARSGEIASIHFSPDGSQLVLGGRNGQVRFWDVAAGAEAGPVLYHEGGLRSCELSADGAWLVTTDGALRVWHRPDRTRRHAWPGGSRHVLALGFDSGGSRLLGATADGSSQVWSTESGGQLSRLSEQPAGFPCSAFSQSGELALTVGLDERVEAVRVWNTRDWSVRSRLIGHTGPVLAATFSPGGTFVITGGNDNTLRFWDPSSGGQLGPAQSLASPVVAVAVRADGRVAACGCRDGSVHLWRTESHERVGPPLALGGPVEFVGFTPDGQLAFAAGSAPEIKLWDAESGQLTLGLPAPNSFCQSVSVSPDRRFLVAGGFRRSTRIYSLGEGEPVGRPLQHQDVIRSVAFLGDGRTAVTASADSTARRWHVPTGIPIGPALRHARKLRLVTGSPDGRLVATGDWGGTIAVWEAPPEVTGSPSELRQWAGQITGVELEEAGAVRVLGAREWPPH